MVSVAPWPSPAPRRPARPIRGLPLGRIGGIPVTVSPSWVLSAALIVGLATPVVAQLVPGTGTVAAVFVSVLLAVLLGVSVLAHELGHCLAARSVGIPVAGVRLYLVGGVSELARSPSTPKEEALIAAAGPGVSALIAVACGLLAGSTTTRTVGWLLLLELALSNGVVAVFNILPALPLDGGRVLRAGVWRVTGRRRLGTTAAVIGGYLVAAALVVWGIVQLVDRTRAGILQAAIAAVMALFVAVGAMAERNRPQRRWPEGVPIASLARPVIQLPVETPVAMASAAAGSRAVVLTGADGAAVGLLDAAAAASLARHDPLAPAVRAAQQVDPDVVVLAHEDPADLVERLHTVAVTHFLLVDDNGHPAGVLLRTDINKLLADESRAGRGRKGHSQGGHRE